MVQVERFTKWVMSGGIRHKYGGTLFRDGRKVARRSSLDLDDATNDEGSLNLWQAAAHNIGRNDAMHEKVAMTNQAVAGYVATGATAPVAITGAAVAGSLLRFLLNLHGLRLGLVGGAKH